MLEQLLNNVKEKKPLIHNITNYVTVNDCANILLACGGSPIMADAIEEVEEITTICDGLNINIGTLNNRTVASMLKAGKKANQLNHPIVLDPVGAGASSLRTDSANKLIDEIQFSVIRGNISEIKTLAKGTTTTSGVDANELDKVNEDNLASVIDFAKEFSKKTKAIIAITGAIDIVASENKAYCIYNGHPLMSSVTGTGCQLSALISAYISANSTCMLEATVAAICAMGVCGQIAYNRMKELDGNASYRNYIIDAIYNLDGAKLESLAKYKEY